MGERGGKAPRPRKSIEPLLSVSGQTFKTTCGAFVVPITQRVHNFGLHESLGRPSPHGCPTAASWRSARVRLAELTDSGRFYSVTRSSLAKLRNGSRPPLQVMQKKSVKRR